jgi:hypothetical protein
LAREVARRLDLELESQEVSPLDRLLGSLGSSGPPGTGMADETDDGVLPTDLAEDDLLDLDDGRPATSPDHAPAWSETTDGTEDER